MHLRQFAGVAAAVLAFAAFAPSGSVADGAAPASIQVPVGALVVAQATSSGWTLHVGDATILGLPEAADCDEFTPHSNAFLTPDPTWPATANSAAASQCESPVEMDSSIVGLSYVQLRSTGETGGSIHISGPAGWLVLACGPLGTSALVGAPGIPWGQPTQACTFSAPPPSSFTTWWGYVENDNSFGDTYGAAA